MKPLITPRAMQAMEKRYFTETGTPSGRAMVRAARALCDLILDRYGPDRRVWFACGPGGNGGDGYACAWMYAREGGRCALFPAGEARNPDAIENLLLARAENIPELDLEDAEGRPDIWVDALYGTGLSRAPEGEAAALIERMNADRARGSAVIAADIPSGLNGTTGAAWTPCVRADVTCTFQCAKSGHWLADGLDARGELLTADIGIPEAYLPADAPRLMESADVADALPPLPRNIHKGMNGRLLIVAGSEGMAGAAVLCAKAALRSGAGLVTVACPASIVPVLQILAPGAMCVPLPHRDGALCEEAAAPLREALKGKDAAVCGCGLSRRASPEVLRLLLGCGLPALFDADALNLIAADGGLKALLRPHHLITPHPGEAARLLGRAMGDPLADALALSALGCQALLKGAATVIPVAGRPVISASGCAGMAKGGSGDCLSGIIGALMATRAARGALTGESLAMCAAVGSEVHGHAGELAQARLGSRGMGPEDLIDSLPRAFCDYER